MRPSSNNALDERHRSEYVNTRTPYGNDDDKKSNKNNDYGEEDDEVFCLFIYKYLMSTTVFTRPPLQGGPGGPGPPWRAEGATRPPLASPLSSADRKPEICFKTYFFGFISGSNRSLSKGNRSKGTEKGPKKFWGA